MDELRVVAHTQWRTLRKCFPFFEEANSEDLRPRLAIQVVWEFVHGAARTALQRVTALDAHRAAKDVAGTAGEHAARAAGDAAAAAYLHPWSKPRNSNTSRALRRVQRAQQNCAQAMTQPKERR